MLTIHDAAIAYTLKLRDLAKLIDPTQSKNYGPRMVILKDEQGRRLACVVESKKGFTIDAVKKMHQPPPVDFGWCLRDSRGRFVKRTGFTTYK